MKEYICNKCSKIFTQKCNWIQHTQNKKYPCIINIKTDKINTRSNFSNFSNSSNTSSNTSSNYPNNTFINNLTNNENTLELENKKFICCYCCKEYTRQDNLKRHLNGERCEVLKLQKQQKENIFVNLVKEDELNKSTNTKLIEISETTKTKNANNDQVSLLLNELKEIKNMFEIKLLEQKNQLEKEFENKLKVKLEEERKKIISDKLIELEKNNIELQKQNYKLQNKMDKIVSKNKIKINKSITNSNNSNNSNKSYYE